MLRTRPEEEFGQPPNKEFDEFIDRVHSSPDPSQRFLMSCLPAQKAAATARREVVYDFTMTSRGS